LSQIILSNYTKAKTMLSILKNCSKLTFNSHLLKHSHKFCNSSKNDFEKARLDLSKVVDH